MTSHPHVWAEHSKHWWLWILTASCRSMPSPCCCSFKLHRKPCSADTAVGRQLVRCFLPCRCLQCSGMSWMLSRWCLVGCCRLPDCLRLHLPPCRDTQRDQDECERSYWWGQQSFFTHFISSYHHIIMSSVCPAETAKLALLFPAGASSKCTCDVTEWLLLSYRTLWL